MHPNRAQLHRAHSTPGERAGPGVGPVTYVPGIDGLRALAVLATLAFHAGVLSGGFLGVDVFFVISGYLITSLLLREKAETGAISLANFYGRRARRLLPSLFVVLACITYLTYRFGTPHDATRLHREGPAAVLYYSNWQTIAHHLSYWDAFGPSSPTSHLWSLAIEEQFYLLWPLLVLAAITLLRARPRLLVVAAALTFLAAGAAMPIGATLGWSADRLYLGTDTHSVGLAAGALLATLLASRSRRRRPGAAYRALGIICLVGLIALIAISGGYRDHWLYFGGFGLASLLSSGVIASVVSAASPFQAVLAARPLVVTGRTSYVIYLVHVPVFWALETTNPGISHWALLAVGTSITGVAATAIHVIVEQPLRRIRWTSRATIIAAAISAVLIAATILVVPKSSSRSALVEGGSAGTGSARVLFLGDSLANDMATALAEHDGTTYTVTDGAIDGCGS